MTGCVKRVGSLVCTQPRTLYRPAFNAARRPRCNPKDRSPTRSGPSYRPSAGSDARRPMRRGRRYCAPSRISRRAAPARPRRSMAGGASSSRRRSRETRGATMPAQTCCNPSSTLPTQPSSRSRLRWQVPRPMVPRPARPMSSRSTRRRARCATACACRCPSGCRASRS